MLLETTIWYAGYKTGGLSCNSSYAMNFTKHMSERLEWIYGCKTEGCKAASKLEDCKAVMGGRGKAGAFQP